MATRKPIDQELQAEAERLAQLPPEVQRQALAIIRAPADDARLPRAERDAARERAATLARLLRHLNSK